MAETLRVSWPHRAWFGVTFLFGVAFVFVLPVFQTNDEDSHWRRAWTVAQADVYCHTVPEVANQLLRLIKFQPDHKRQKVARVQYVLDALNDRGYNIPEAVDSNACSYFPLGYVPAGVTARLVAFTLHSRPRIGGMICGYYAARLANWLMLSVGIFLLLRELPWARSLILVFYSIPEVLQQSVAIGLDSFLFLTTCLLLIVLFRRAHWRSVAWIALIVTLMTVTKPIYAPLSLIALPIIVTLAAARRLGWQGLAASAALLLPLPAWWAWVQSIPQKTLTGGAPGWVNPPLQIEFLKNHPGRLLLLFWAQLKDTFGDDLMHGRWTSIFGAFGWSAFEMSRVGYFALLLAILCALVADWGSQAVPPIVTPEQGWKPRAAWVLAVLGPLGVIAAAIVAMYLYFSKVGAESVNGVQGRYYLAALLVLGVLGLFGLKRRVKPPRELPALAPYFVAGAGLLCALADGLAVKAIQDFYWAG